MIDRCPGQYQKNISAEALQCPKCGYEMEIFSDEMKGKCGQCGNVVYRDVLPACVDWCKAARDCVGSEVFSARTKNKSILFKDRLIKELEEYFGEDQKRIKHAKKVLGFAEELLRKEGGDWQIVVPAAILHDVGIKIAEEKHGSSAGHLQEKFGPEIAEKILLKLGFKKEDIEEICRIIGHHHSRGKVKSLNFDIVLDADWLVNLKDEVKERSKLKEIINKVFVTETAKTMAKAIYL